MNGYVFPAGWHRGNVPDDFAKTTVCFDGDPTTPRSPVARRP
jgi:hypothetical protein